MRYNKSWFCTSIRPATSILAMFVALTAVTGCQRSEMESSPQSSNAIAGVADFESDSFDGGLFGGVLPCASCPGVETRIQFRNDHLYLRRRLYQGGDSDRLFFDLGRWAAYPNGRLVLTGNRGEITRFAVVDEDRIQLLDSSGMPISTATNLSLTAESGEFGPFGPADLRGMYTYFADAAILSLCHTDVTFPVAMVERHVDLESAYLQNRAAPQAPLLVEISGRLEEVPAMEGDGMEEALVVSNLNNVFPGESCLDQSALTDSLEWILQAVDGVPVIRDDVSALPSLTFGVDRVTGSTGCNRLTGPFELSEGEFRMGPLVMTRRACRDTLESVFVDLLETVQSYRLYGDQLQLTSTDGSVAVFARGEEQ